MEEIVKEPKEVINENAEEVVNDETKEETRREKRKRLKAEKKKLNPEYKAYITGLKGLACLLIMFGHFLGIYRYAEAFGPHIEWLDNIYKSKYGFLIGEGYWLYLFFIISGYLVAKSRIKGILNLIKKCILRFLRLGLPILFSYLVIFGMYKYIGFTNHDTNQLFQNNWYQGYYTKTYTLLDVIRGPIDVLINFNFDFYGPYWVLKDMFIASLYIYCIKYIIHLFKDSEIMMFFASIGVIIASFYLPPIIAAVLLGTIFSFYDNISELKRKSLPAIVILIVAFMFDYWPIDLKNSILFGLAICCIGKIPALCWILSTKVIEFLGKISWGIYSFHWALMCCLGANIMLTKNQELGLIKSYQYAFIACSIATIIISIVYYFSFEKFSSLIVKGLDKLFTIKKKSIEEK